MFEAIWPTLPAAFRDEMILQCVKHLKSTPEEYDAFARLVAEVIKARPQSVKAQWRMSNTFGTTQALTRDPKRAAPFFAVTYMAVRKDDLTALYTALGVTHKDLEVAASSAVDNPPTKAQFASVLAKGLALRLTGGESSRRGEIAARLVEFAAACLVLALGLALLLGFTLAGI